VRPQALLCENELGAAFADVWCAIPKVVFSHTLDSVQGNARLAEASLAEEIAAALDATRTFGSRVIYERYGRRHVGALPLPAGGRRSM
jgi:hypothetical protein